MKNPRVYAFTNSELFYLGLRDYLQGSGFELASPRIKEVGQSLPRIDNPAIFNVLFCNSLQYLHQLV